MNSVTLSCLAEGRMRLFGAEILTTSLWELLYLEIAHTCNVQAKASGNMQGGLFPWKQSWLNFKLHM